MSERRYRIGEVYWMKFAGSGSEQKGIRPGLVFQNNLGNQFSPNIIALPLTSNLKHATQATHVTLSANETGIPRDSVVLCENPERMSKDRIGSYITTVQEKDMGRIAAANLIATSAIAFIDPGTLAGIWEMANRLNEIE